MKSKKKVIAIILVLIILALGAAAAYIYFFTDLFRSPEELFYKYVGKAADTESQYNYQDLLKELEASQTKSCKGKSNVSIQLKGTENQSKDKQAALNLINGVGIEVETKSKPSENKSAYDLNLKFGGTNIANLEVVKDKDVYGIKSDLLDSKYIAVENNNLKDLVRKFGGSTTNVPDKIEMVDIYKLLYISKEDQDKITKTYEDVIKNSISSDKFTKTENVNKKVNGTDVNTTAYSVKLDGKDFLNITNKVLETLKDDDTLLNLIIDKMNTLVELTPTIKETMNTKSIYSSKITQNLTKEQLKQVIDQVIKEFKGIENSSNNVNASVEVVVYAANLETVRMEFKANDEVVMAFDFSNKDNRKHITMYAQEAQKLNYDYSRYALSSKTQSSELVKIMEIESKTTKNNDEMKAEGEIIAYSREEKVFKLGFDVSTKGKAGEGTNNQTCKFNLETEEISIGFTIDSEIEYTDNVEIEDLNSGNSNILNDMSKADIEKLFNKISQDFERNLQKKFTGFGITNSKTMTNSLFDNLMNN